MLELLNVSTPYIVGVLNLSLKEVQGTNFVMVNVSTGQIKCPTYDMIVLDYETLPKSALKSLQISLEKEKNKFGRLDTLSILDMFKSFFAKVIGSPRNYIKYDPETKVMYFNKKEYKKTWVSKNTQFLKVFTKTKMFRMYIETLLDQEMLSRNIAINQKRIPAPSKKIPHLPPRKEPMYSNIYSEIPPLIPLDVYLNINRAKERVRTTSVPQIINSDNFFDDEFEIDNGNESQNEKENENEKEEKEKKEKKDEEMTYIPPPPRERPRISRSYTESILSNSNRSKRRLNYSNYVGPGSISLPQIPEGKNKKK